MNEKSIHLIYIPFTGVGLYGGFRGQKWYRDRIEIFKRYTFQSLKNQSEKKFVLWLSFRPEEYNNPATLRLRHFLTEEGMEFFMTFHGLMYHDDKFSDEIGNKLKNIGRILRWRWREKLFRNIVSSIREVWRNKNRTLAARLQEALNTITGYMKGKEWVYVTRIDSDDLFHKEVVKEIQEIEPFEGALTYDRGYVFNIMNGEMAEWLPLTNPPFHTIIFPMSIFANAEDYLEYMRGFRSHEDIRDIFKTKQLKDFRYMVLVHGSHISTIWKHPFQGKFIKDKSNILEQFGIHA